MLFRARIVVSIRCYGSDPCENGCSHTQMLWFFPNQPSDKHYTTAVRLAKTKHRPIAKMIFQVSGFQKPVKNSPCLKVRKAYPSMALDQQVPCSCRVQETEGRRCGKSRAQLAHTFSTSIVILSHGSLNDWRILCRLIMFETMNKAKNLSHLVVGTHLMK